MILELELVIMCLIVVGLNQVYIVYMGDLPKGDVSVSNIHIGMLEEIVPGFVDYCFVILKLDFGFVDI